MFFDDDDMQQMILCMIQQNHGYAHAKVAGEACIKKGFLSDRKGALGSNGIVAFIKDHTILEMLQGIRDH